MKRSQNFNTDDDEEAVEEKGLDDNSEKSTSMADNNDDAQAGASNTLLPVPYILGGDFYEIKTRDNDGNVKAKCKKCLNKVISGNISSTGNFRTHYKLKHPTLLSTLDAKKVEANKARTSPNQEKGKAITKLFGKLPKESKKISQEEANAAISSFIVEEMLPLSMVEKPSFRNLCSKLRQGTKLPLSFPNRRTFVEGLKLRKDQMLYSIKNKLEKSDFVCTTADLWTSHNKSYLGVTCHTIDKETLERESYVLAIRRMLFRHTHDKIGESLFKIHEEFDITEKITKTVTDNASNFAKAFDVYGLLELEEDGSDTSTPVQDDAEGHDDGEKEEEGDEELMHVPINEILNETKIDEDEEESDQSSITLPKHMRCCAHTINLTITADVAKIKDRKFNAKYKAAFGKMRAMWNLTAKSTNASDTVEKKLQCKLPAPNKTRWFALLRAVKFLLSKVKSKAELDELFDALNLPKLTNAEYLFLVEYCSLTEHLAEALDILQGEKACYYGFVVPALLVIQKNLSPSSFPNLVHCEPLRLCLLGSISRRFEKFLGIATEKDLRDSEWKDAFIATVAHPRFKPNGVPQHLQAACEKLFIEQCEKTESKMRQKEWKILSLEGNGTADTSETEKDQKKDFFAVLDRPPGERALLQEKRGKTEAVLFIASNTTESLDCLHQYPIVKEVFIEFNTTLPSEAPVERLFSVGGQVRTPRRNRLSDLNFEMLTMLKANHF